MNKTIQDELQQQLEFSIEDQRLKEVIEVINNEILRYIDKRKAISDYILKYRKNIIEEYKDDEDKIIEYFDHERYVKEENFKVIDRKLKELTILKDSPYFGKVCFREEDFGVDNIYIGRFGVTLENSFEPLIVDWRAPIAALFYNGGGDEAYYEAPLGKVSVSILERYQYIIKRGILKGLFNSEVDIKDDILQMILSKNSSDKLKDIIMTIQKEQDNIIRQPRNKIVVVDGVAGSGKTTIALHRIAFLIYNNRKLLEDKVLILGPNTIFMDYISNVLPTLGETGVFQTTFKDLCMELLDVDSTMDVKDVMENIFLENDEFINKVNYKKSSIYVNFLDEYIDTLEDSFFSYNDVIFRNKVVVTKSELEIMFKKDFNSLPLFRRNKKVKRIIFSKLKDIRDDEFRKIENQVKEEKNSYSKEELIYHINDIELKRKLAIRELINDLIYVKTSLKNLDGEEIEVLYKNLNGTGKYIEEDLAAMVYLKIKLQGLRLKKDIKHIVIDEAQDYSELQFRVIKDLTGIKSMTIVGDSNQRLISEEEKNSFLNLSNVFYGEDIEYFKLEKSYRSTKEIMEYSNNFIKGSNVVPIVRNGKSVEQLKCCNEVDLYETIISSIRKMREDNLENIGIICKGMYMAKEIDRLLEGKTIKKLIDDEHIHYVEGVTIIPSYYAKGLEFDGVIIVADEKELNSYSNIIYVMCTRALHNLTVIQYM